MQIIATILFLIAGICFIMGLKLLGKPETARKGNLVSAVGMTLAALGTLTSIMSGTEGAFDASTLIWIFAGMVVGTAIGIPAAKMIKMTAMPEMVALFNGFGGIASLLVGWAELQRHYATAHAAVADAAHSAEAAIETGSSVSVSSAIAIFLAVFIGGVTFTGSVVAWGKLSGKLPSPPVLYAGQRVINGIMVLALLACGVWIAIDPTAQAPLYISIVLSFILGVAFVVPIGGGDMPVVISLLNSYSGLAACAAGFAVNNVLLIITGALVGASGIVLTRIMCMAMNRSLPNVLFSGFGAVDTGGGGGGGDENREAKILTPDKAYYMLEAAQKVIFVPGYGMAVAQAQHAVKELATLMEANGTEVEFVVHPVAGRMPGHMNVLLAEADVPYESLAELDDINPTMETVDVAIVLGANDVVNPLALEEGNAISGMPIAEVQRAKTIFTMKRSLAAGYAGIDNPLFYLDNNYMVLGDAKKTLHALIDEFKAEA